MKRIIKIVLILIYVLIIMSRISFALESNNIELNNQTNIVDNVDFSYYEETSSNAENIYKTLNTILNLYPFMFALGMLIILVPLYKYIKLKIFYKSLADEKNVENHNENIIDETKDIKEKIKKIKVKLIICSIIAIFLFYSAMMFHIISNFAHI